MKQEFRFYKILCSKRQTTKTINIPYSFLFHSNSLPSFGGLWRCGELNPGLTQFSQNFNELKKTKLSYIN